jgi:hypothetical protein
MTGFVNILSFFKTFPCCLLSILQCFHFRVVTANIFGNGLKQQPSFSNSCTFGRETTNQIHDLLQAYTFPTVSLIYECILLFSFVVYKKVNCKVITGEVTLQCKKSDNKKLTEWLSVQVERQNSEKTTFFKLSSYLTLIRMTKDEKGLAFFKGLLL